MHQFEWRQQNWSYATILQQAADTKLKKSIQHDKFAFKEKRQRMIKKAPTYKHEDMMYTPFEKAVIAERKKEKKRKEMELERRDRERYMFDEE